LSDAYGLEIHAEEDWDFCFDGTQVIVSANFIHDGICFDLVIAADVEEAIRPGAHVRAYVETASSTGLSERCDNFRHSELIGGSGRNLAWIRCNGIGHD